MDDLLQTVRAAADEFYEVYGELGRESASDIWYLARDRATKTLVALRLRLTGTDSTGKPDYELDVEKELSSTVAVGFGDCPSCSSPIRRWAKFCTQCGKNLGLGTKVPTSPGERAALAEEVRLAAAAEYDVLGEMPWDNGAGIVYFAIQKSNGRLVRLRLKEDEAEGLVLKETRGILPFAERFSAAYLTQSGSDPVPESPPGVKSPQPASKFAEPQVGARKFESPQAIRGRGPGAATRLRLMNIVVALLILTVIYLLATRH